MPQCEPKQNHVTKGTAQMGGQHRIESGYYLFIPLTRFDALTERQHRTTGKCQTDTEQYCYEKCHGNTGNQYHGRENEYRKLPQGQLSGLFVHATEVAKYAPDPFSGFRKNVTLRLTLNRVAKY